MIEGLPVLDAHMHLDPGGRPREAVRAFKGSGGTHLIIVHKPYRSISEDSPEGIRRAFRTTFDLTDIARKEGVKAWCVVGPYPGTLPYLTDDMGLEEAVAVHLESLDIAFEHIDEGRALGIGEVGRVHFKVDRSIQVKCDEVLSYALNGARKRDCPVVLHTESPHDNPGLFAHLVSLVDSAGMDRKKVIKHYSGWEAADPAVGLGLSVSMQARRENLEMALGKGLRFLLETDYIDDPDRPNVVMPPDTVPKKIEWAYKRGLLDTIKHRDLMVDLPAEVLGIDMME